MNSFVKTSERRTRFQPGERDCFSGYGSGAEAHEFPVPARVQFVDELLGLLQALRKFRQPAASRIEPQCAEIRVELELKCIEHSRHSVGLACSHAIS